MNEERCILCNKPYEYEYGVIRKYEVKVRFNMKYDYATKVVIQ